MLAGGARPRGGVRRGFQQRGQHCEVSRMDRGKGGVIVIAKGGAQYGATGAGGRGAAPLATPARPLLPKIPGPDIAPCFQLMYSLPQTYPRTQNATMVILQN